MRQKTKHKIPLKRLIRPDKRLALLALLFIRRGIRILPPALLCICVGLAGMRAEGAVWIKPPYTSFREFKAELRAFGPPHISYAESLLRRQRKQAIEFELKEKLLIAQELYLSGEEQKALKAFQSITDLSPLADWRAEDRRILLYSFLRRAQSEEDESKRKALLLSASDFISKEELEDYPDRDLFPPPLMESLSLIKEKTHLLSVDWNKIFPDHEIILINGKQIQKDIRDIRSRALYRTHALSSSHVPYLNSISLSDLIQKQIKTKKLTEGYCKKIKVRSDIQETEKARVLSQPDCPKPILTARLQKDAESKKKRQKQKKTPLLVLEDPNKNALKNSYFPSSPLYKAANYGTYPSLLDSREFNDSVAKLEEENSLWSKKHSIYILLGAGILATALIISLDQQKEPPKGEYIY